MTLWLFLMQPYLPLGSVRVADVNAEEAVVATAPGDAGRYLIGILAERITLPVAGKHIIKLLFPLAVVTRYPTAKFSAFPATRTPAHTADANFNAEQAPSCSAN